MCRIHSSALRRCAACSARRRFRNGLEVSLCLGIRASLIVVYSRGRSRTAFIPGGACPVRDRGAAHHRARRRVDRRLVAVRLLDGGDARAARLRTEAAHVARGVRDVRARRPGRRRAHVRRPRARGRGARRRRPGSCRRGRRRGGRRRGGRGTRAADRAADPSPGARVVAAACCRFPLAAAGYGVLLGLGFTTFVLSFAVWALAGASIALGDPALGLAIGLAFGAGRALPVICLAPFAGGDRGGAITAAMCERPADPARLAPRSTRSRWPRARSRWEPRERAGPRRAERRGAVRRQRLRPDARPAAWSPGSGPSGRRCCWAAAPTGSARHAPRARRRADRVARGRRDRGRRRRDARTARASRGARRGRARAVGRRCWPGARATPPAPTGSGRSRPPACRARILLRWPRPTSSAGPRCSATGCCATSPGPAGSRVIGVDTTTGAQELLRASPAHSSPIPRPTAGCCSTCARPAARRSCGSVPLRRSRRPTTSCCSCIPPRAGATASTSAGRRRHRHRGRRPEAAAARRARRRRHALDHRAHARRRLRHAPARAPRAAADGGHPPRAGRVRRVGARGTSTRREGFQCRGARCSGCSPSSSFSPCRSRPRAAPYKHTHAADRGRDRRRRRDGRQRRDHRGDGRAASRRQRRRRRGRRGGRARRDRAVLVRDRRRRLHADPQADGKVTTIGSREKSPAAMEPDSFMENGAPLAFNDARYSGLSAGVPGTVAGWDRALRQYGTWSLRRALRARRIDVAREGFVIDRTFNEQAQDNAAYFDDIRSSEALYLDPDGTAHDVGTVQRNPDMARAYERIGQARRRTASTAAPIADALVERGPAAAADRRRRPHLAPGTDDAARPARLHRARARAHARRLSRPRRLRHGPALLGRLDRRRGAQHPRGGARLAMRSRRPRVPLVPGGLAASRSPTAARSSATRRSSTSRCARLLSQDYARPSGTR